MRWNRQTGWLGEVLFLGALLALCILGLMLLSAASAEDKKLSIYAPQATFSLAVHDRNHAEYVVLSEALEPLGELQARAEGGTWRVRLNRVEGEFRPGETRAKVARNTLELPAPFLLENQHGMAPLASLAAILARFLDTRVDFHTNSRRLFVGGAATRFTVEMKKDQALVLSFSAPVNPTISTEPGQLRMSFAREPVVSGTGTFQFADDRLVSSVRFTEGNGTAALSVLSGTPLIAEFSDGGKTITVSAAPSRAQAPPAPADAVPAAPVTAEGSPGVPAGPPLPPSFPVTPRPGWLVVVDASHGGEERGAGLSDTLAEKDITLAFARRLRAELLERGVSAVLLRDSDTGLTLEQRATTTNTARPGLYVALHATASGAGVRVFTAMLAPPAARPGPFLPWETAQASFLAQSRGVAAGIAEGAERSGLPVAFMPAPVRPLNNIATAAIAVEIAPPRGQVEAFDSPQYQQQVAQMLAGGIAAAKARLAEVK